MRRFTRRDSRHQDHVLRPSRLSRERREQTTRHTHAPRARYHLTLRNENCVCCNSRRRRVFVFVRASSRRPSPPREDALFRNPRRAPNARCHPPRSPPRARPRRWPIETRGDDSTTRSACATVAASRRRATMTSPPPTRATRASACDATDTSFSTRARPPRTISRVGNDWPRARWRFETPGATRRGY